MCDTKAPSNSKTANWTNYGSAEDADGTHFKLMATKAEFEHIRDKGGFPKLDDLSTFINVVVSTHNITADELFALHRFRALFPARVPYTSSPSTPVAATASTSAET
jgi:hypothetical protein